MLLESRFSFATFLTIIWLVAWSLGGMVACRFVHPSILFVPHKLQTLSNYTHRPSRVVSAGSLFGQRGLHFLLSHVSGCLGAERRSECRGSAATAAAVVTESEDSKDFDHSCVRESFLA